MPSFRRYVVHKGFSLIELLIVILIISIVYFLGFDGIELGEKRVKTLTPLNLKSTIVNSEYFTGEATLLCTNNCRTCYLRSDISSNFEEYKGPIDFNNLTAYTIDDNDGLIPIEYERYQDQPICLLMNFYRNGSSTQIILEYDNKIYFLPAFFGKAQEFSSIGEAKEYWLRLSTSVSDQGEFY